MHNDAYIYAAYVVTWVVLITFTVATVRRVRRAEQTTRAITVAEER